MAEAFAAPVASPVTTDPTDISVVVATYGDIDRWGPMAERAIRSVGRQSRAPADVTRVHGSSLHEARNEGARLANGRWLCFLDADDELDGGYLEAMERATQEHWHFNMAPEFIFQPATLGVVDGKEDDAPVLIPQANLLERNYLVIGTVVRKDPFLRLGGFDDWPILEDWELFIRFFLDGATTVKVPEAVYRVHVNMESRNNQALHNRVYNDIRNRHLAAAQSLGLL